jgi:ABC-type transporter Mla MlaB component
MLRITTQDHPRVLLFRLEGRLEGPSLAELVRCWRGRLAESGKTRLCVDLNGVTHIDAAGKAHLAEMHEHGAEFIAGDLMTKAVVAEIVGQAPS